ncbi:hypothetical protein M1M07_13840 [Rhodococcus sp. HM1]|uniref:hypothetical protein n=1 Tax=Rhodococcus sp. HM1 TaxID=2937759 RepID=UPI00200B2AF2|nr:hypothetical protein [Rhodococcus sp. HM1]MCK8672198.1 hypothetical protein [Rhodococcus sp. HM1]
MQSDGVVQVDHHQFSFGDPTVDTLDPLAQGTLIDVGDGAVWFYTGIAYGPVRVRVELLDRPPTDLAQEGWEVVEETIVSATQAMVVSAADGTVCTTIDPVPAGTYRVRAHARGRDTHFGLDVDEIVEDYLICLWPTTTRIADAQVRTLRKTDTAWSPQPQVDRPEPSRAYVYIRDDSGEVVTVAPRSREALAVRAVLHTFGGKPLTPALEAIYAARHVAGLDRDLIDRVEALDDDRQRAFARWCVHRAWERAGLVRSPWFRDRLAEMDAGHPVHPDFLASTAARNRIDVDPRIRLTLVSGLPASAELVQQYEALLAYARSMYSEATPLESAIEALRHTAQTYGMDYPELFARARRDFFGDHITSDSEPRGLGD